MTAYNTDSNLSTKMKQQAAQALDARCMAALVRHVLRYGQVVPDAFNAQNCTEFTAEQLEQTWLDFAAQKCKLQLCHDKTPAISLSALQQQPSPLVLSIQNRFSSQIQKRSEAPLKKPRIMSYNNRISMRGHACQPFQSLQQFLAQCELEFEVLCSSKLVPMTAYAVIHSIKTIILATHKPTVLPVFTDRASKANAVVFHDENQFWLSNCGFDGAQNERLGVEVNGAAMKNGQRVLLRDEPLVFRVCGQWFLWRRLK